MANYTPNLNLEKPLQSEDYDVDVFNRNADKIDNFAGTIPARALTSDKLTTGAKINGVNFKGDTDITLPVATTSVAGTVNPDGETILVNSGVISVNEDKIDGAWLNATEERISLTTVTAIGTYNIDLSSILPNDGNNYECVILYRIERRDDSSYDTAYRITSNNDKLWLTANVEGDTSSGSNYRRTSGQFIAIVDSSRKLKLLITEHNLNANTLDLIMYRKCRA